MAATDAMRRVLDAARRRPGLIALGAIVAVAAGTTTYFAPQRAQLTSSCGYGYGYGTCPSPASGYWLLTSDGGVFNFDATWYGSPKAAGTVGGVALTGLSAGPGGVGYVISRANGGVFNFGTPFYGSEAGKLPAGVRAVGIATDPATGGYWVLTSDGGVFNFHAPWFGSPKAAGTVGGVALTGIAAGPGGNGYLVSRANGGVFNFGVPFHGSEAGKLPAGVTGVGIATN